MGLFQRKKHYKVEVSGPCQSTSPSGLKCQDDYEGHGPKHIHFLNGGKVEWD